MAEPAVLGQDLCLAMDIGGTKTIVALVARSGQLVAKTLFETLPDAEAQLERCVLEAQKLCEESELESERIAGIGVNVPGLADNGKGELVYAPYRGWRNVRVRDFLKWYWPNARIEIANDVNACALAETMYGAGRGKSHLLWVTVSTGIGSGIIANGEIYEGSCGAAGELGHVIVEWSDGSLCGCGNKGCLEAQASGTAIARMAAKRCSEDQAASSDLADYFRRSGAKIDALNVANAARDGIGEAIEIYEQAGMYLGRALSYAINLFNPECVVIGGGVSLSFELMEKKMREVIAESVIGEQNVNTPVILTSLGYNAAVIGAASLVFYKC
ncbi:ROK family protein [Cohnella faecalis]|uniref:ROK family protein n=1 Tax=Cohnella faecalis TaxID=2315694 RepID=UPI003612F00C